MGITDLVNTPKPGNPSLYRSSDRRLHQRIEKRSSLTKRHEPSLLTPRLHDASILVPGSFPLSTSYLSRHCMAAGQSHAISSLRVGAAARCHLGAAHSDPGTHLPEPGSLSLVSHPRRRDGLCLRRSRLPTRSPTPTLRRLLKRINAFGAPQSLGAPYMRSICGPIERQLDPLRFR